jgi:hypothetical protein
VPRCCVLAPLGPLATRRLGAAGGSRGDGVAPRPRRVAARGVCPREPWPSTAAQLDDPAVMLARAARARAGDVAADRRRAVTFSLRLDVVGPRDA